MERGISKAGENEYLIMQARNELETHFQQQQAANSSHSGISSSPDEDSSTVGLSRPDSSAATPGSGISPMMSADTIPNDLKQQLCKGAPVAAAQVGVGGGGFIDTPTYTFTLPDLTVYPGKPRNVR